MEFRHDHHRQPIRVEHQQRPDHSWRRPDGTANYAFNLASTPTPGYVTISGGINLAPSNYDNVSLALTGAPGGTSIFSGASMNLATANYSQAALTLSGITMKLTGNGQIGTGSNNGNNNYPNTALVTLANGSYLGFFSQSQLGNYTPNASAALSSSGNATYDGGNNFSMTAPSRPMAGP